MPAKSCNIGKAEREAAKAGSWNEFRSAMKGSKCDAATLGELWRANKPGIEAGKQVALRQKAARKTVTKGKAAPHKTEAASSGCVEQTSARYTKASRKAPPYPAKECAGEVKPGDDGMYQSQPYGSRGYYRWVKIDNQVGEPKRQASTATKSSMPKKPKEPKMVQFLQVSSKEDLPEGCEEKFTARYQSRNAPAYPANKCCGMVLPGKDGTLHESRADERGICTWQPVKNAVAMPTKLQRPAVRFSLTSPEGALYSTVVVADEQQQRSAAASQPVSSQGYMPLPASAFKEAPQPDVPPAEQSESQTISTITALDELMDQAEQYGRVMLLTRKTVVRMQLGVPRKALFGQQYQYEDEPTESAIGTVEWSLNVESSDSGAKGWGLIFRGGDMDSFALTGDELDQGLGYLCTGSGCDPIWLLVDEHNYPIRADEKK